MRLETVTGHAIQILKHLHYYKEDLHTKKSLAEAVGITQPLATRIIVRLKQRDCIVNISGLQGSYVLGRSAEEISFYDVVLAMQGESRVSHCMRSGGECGKKRQCKTHKFLKTLQDSMTEVMLSTSIADLV